MKKNILVSIFFVVNILFFSITCFSEEITINSNEFQVNLLSSTDQQTTIEYTFGSFNANPITIDDEQHYHLQLEKEGLTYEKGKPELPKITRSIIIPDNAKCEVKIIESEYVEYQMSIAPSKGILYRDVNPADVPYEFSDIYEKDEFYPSITSELGTPYILRDFRGVTVVVYPFTYNPQTKTLRVYHHIKLEINNIGIDDVNVKERKNESYNINFAEIYENHFINFNTNRYTSISEYGRMIVICDGSFLTEIQPYVDWKRQKGIDTDLYNVSSIGTTSAQIKDFIQDEYDLGDGLIFVQLVGDVAQIPTYYVDTSFGADPVYSLVDGGDDYPDIFVGRFSATTDAHIETQVERTIHYERDISSGSWLHWGLGVASDEGPGDDGEYDWEHLNNIRTDLMGYTYTYVGQVYDPGATDTDVTEQFNWGRSFVNYTGHGSTTNWTTSGFNTTDINNLTNSFELPFICDVACLNGNFTGGTTCFAETFLRATHTTTGDPTGAIAIYASSKNQPWNPPMDAQDEVTDLLVGNNKRTIGGLFFNGSCHMMDEYTGQGDTFKSWNIFGDASLMVRTDTPTAISVAHNPHILVGDTSFFVNTGTAYSLVCLSDEDSNIISSGYANYLGDISLSFPALAPEDLTLTITYYNKITHIATIPVIQPGIWTGLGGTSNWHVPGNWSANVIPDATINVTIPAGTPHDPGIWLGNAYCNNLTLESGATLSVYDDPDVGETLRLYVSNDMNVYGYINMWGGTESFDGEIEVQGEIRWYSGSRLYSTANDPVIRIYGSWRMYSGAQVYMNNGTIMFLGTTDAYIENDDPGCYLNNVGSYKSGGAIIGFSAWCDADTYVNGYMYVHTGAAFNSYSSHNIFLQGDLNNHGTFIHNYGTLVMTGPTQYMRLTPGCYLNNFSVDPSNYVYFIDNGSDILTVNGNVVIDGGALNCGSFTLEVGGTWTNNVGTGGFGEGTSTVRFNKQTAGVQYIYGDEHFNILEVDAPLDGIRPSGDVSCNIYDWTSGGVSVTGASFTAYDLADNSLYGFLNALSGGDIILYESTYVDLFGDILIFNNGLIQVNGGLDESYWATSGITNNVTVETGGVLDFVDMGIQIFNAGSLVYDIQAGSTIKVGKDFICDRIDYNPAGGVLEFQGGSDALFSMGTGSTLYDVLINKTATDNAIAKVIKPSKREKLSVDRDGSVVELTRAQTVTATSELHINGDFVLDLGMFDTNGFDMYVARDWANNVGEVEFVEGVQKVVFDGVNSSVIHTPETFYDLHLDKTYVSFDGLQTGLGDNNGVDVTVTNNLELIDGTMELNNPTNLVIGNNIVISVGATLNANDSGIINISLVADWFNLNSSGGFDAGTSSVVTFHGGSLGDLHSIAENNYFNDIVINSNSSYARPSSLGPVIYCKNMDIIQGKLKVSSYRVVVDEAMSISGILEMSSSDDSLFVGDITWETGSSSIIADSKMFVTGNWTNSGGIFSPGTSTVTFDGTGDVSINGNETFYNLTLDKVSSADWLTPNGDLTIGNDLTINPGALYSGANTISVGGDATVNSGGVLYMQANSTLALEDGSSLYVDGYLYVVGSAGNYATVTHQSTGFYGFNINSGGYIGAQYAIFEWMDGNGIYLLPGANLHGSFTFNHCIFRNGHDAPSALLALNSDNVFTSTGAEFYDNTSGLTGYNVWKYFETGEATFNDVTGDFWGASDEYDPYNRVHWSGGVLPPIDDLTIQYNSGTDRIELSWSPVPGAVSYNVYSSTNPYATFPDDWTSETTGPPLTTTTWDEPTSTAGSKKFYCVTAENTADSEVSRKKGALGKIGISEEAGK